MPAPDTPAPLVGQSISRVLVMWREDNGRQMYQAVDWRCALTDALLSVNTATGSILDDFERRCLDPHYRAEDVDA
jgi:glycerol kinase